MNQLTVHFHHANKTIPIQSGQLLSDVCAQAGYPLDLVCGGKGTCGKCQVLIRQNGIQKHVLACTTSVTESMILYLSSEQLAKEAQILSNHGENFVFNPAISKHFYPKSKAQTSEYGSMFDEWLKAHPDSLNYEMIKKAHFLLSKKDISGITLITYREKVIDVQPNDTRTHLYGMAVDIGTTSVAAYLYDLVTGQLLGTYSSLNQQIKKGADVISRILHCEMADDGLDEMQDAVVSTINKLIDQAANDYPAINDHLLDMVFCGNSTMQHLFHGLSPETLGRSPFISVTQDLLKATGHQLKLNVTQNAQTNFLPSLGGFVGGDTTSVLLALPDQELKRLVIDLGTNGEIAVGSHGKYYVASTACGPALEGAGLTFGMRGTHGAIESFEIIEDTIHYHVIGDVKAQGICGSGIVDILAELLRQKIILPSGKLLRQEDLIAKNPYHPLAKYLTLYDNSPAFLVVPPEDSASGQGVYVTQKDIRQIQLAKSAIYTGCIMLLEKSGFNEDLLDEILLSGAFGNYINIHNAQLIGLIPKITGVSTYSIGNGAGLGVQKYLLDQSAEALCMDLKAHALHVELASDPNFQNQYIHHMAFNGGSHVS